MPRDDLYKLRFSPHEQRYTITYGSLRLSREITAKKSAWEEWLNSVSSFAFEDREGGHCTIRKERLQRGDAYWYAYRSIQGRTKKRYLGRTADLTLSRLEEVSTHFTAGERKAFQAVFTQKPRKYAPNQRPSGVVPLLETKLHPPQLPAWLVERTHLYAWLDTSLAQTHIDAGPGWLWQNDAGQPVARHTQRSTRSSCGLLGLTRGF